MTEEQLVEFRKEMSEVGLHTTALVIAHVNLNGDVRTYVQGGNADLCLLSLMANELVSDLSTGRKKRGEPLPPLKNAPRALKPLMEDKPEQ